MTDLSNGINPDAGNESVGERTLAAAVGKVVITFNLLESEVGEFLTMELACALEGRATDRVSGAVNGTLAFRPKIDLLAAIILDGAPEEEERNSVQAFIRSAQSAEDGRNRIVHTRWALSCGSTEGWTGWKANTRGRKGTRVQAAPADVKGILGIAEQIQQARQAMMELVRLRIQ